MKMIKHKGKRIKITEEVDVALAAFDARSLAEAAGFRQTEQFMIATAVSELARNIYRYAMQGDIIIRVTEQNTTKGIEIIAEDHGPGIEDIQKALEDHFSTSGSLGLGLPGVKRLMDEFTIDSERGRGTTVAVRKWV